MGPSFRWDDIEWVERMGHEANSLARWTTAPGTRNYSLTTGTSRIISPDLPSKMRTLVIGPSR
jgi:hypothetical protein